MEQKGLGGAFLKTLFSLGYIPIHIFLSCDM